MRTRIAKPGEQAISLLEVLFVITILLVIASMLLPSLGGSGRSPGLRCLSNLRQNLIGLEIWQTDHSKNLPWQISVTNGGTMESALQGKVSENFRVLLRYGSNPGTFICPLDKSRRVAISNEALADQNISYFLNLDPGTNNPSHAIVSGDRNLKADGKPVEPGLFTLNEKIEMSWTDKLHPRGGNLAFVDGHVAYCRSTNLTHMLREQGAAANRWVIP